MANLLDASDGCTRLFLGDLPLDITKEQVAYVFGRYGKIVDLHLMTQISKSGDRSAFMQYESAEQAAIAISSLHGVYSFRHGAKPVIVRTAAARPDRDRKGKGRGFYADWEAEGAEGDLPADPGFTGADSSQQPSMRAAPDPRTALAATLRLQSMHPSVAQAYQDHGVNPASGVSPADNFMHQNLLLQNTGMDPSVAQAYAEILQQAAGSQIPQVSYGGRPPRADQHKVWIGNIPEDLTKEDLLPVFSRYGTVTDAAVVAGSGGKKPFAIVVFNDLTAAEQAVHGLNGVFEYKRGPGPLLVRLKREEPPRVRDRPY